MTRQKAIAFFGGEGAGKSTASKKKRRTIHARAETKGVPGRQR